jgi:hypothetical protein
MSQMLHIESDRADVRVQIVEVDAMDSNDGEAASQEQTPDAEDAAAPTASPGPSPADSGSGGAQSLVGARASDRVAAGEPLPDEPPFDTDSEGTAQNS